MNDGGPVSEFFYNLIPGSIFLLIFNAITENYFVNKIIDVNNEALLTAFYIVGGLFIGFLFQCATKAVRSNKWNYLSQSKVKEEQEKDFARIYKYFGRINENNLEQKKKDLSRIFSLMDNKIRGEDAAFLPTHFSSRFALWANFHWGSVILLGLSIEKRELSLMIAFSIFAIFTYKVSLSHLKNFYDTIFKTYFMKDKKLSVFNS